MTRRTRIVTDPHVPQMKTWNNFQKWKGSGVWGRETGEGKGGGGGWGMGGTTGMGTGGGVGVGRGMRVQQWRFFFREWRVCVLRVTVCPSMMSTFSLRAAGSTRPAMPLHLSHWLHCGNAVVRLLPTDKDYIYRVFLDNSALCDGIVGCVSEEWACDVSDCTHMNKRQCQDGKNRAENCTFTCMHRHTHTRTHTCTCARTHTHIFTHTHSSEGAIQRQREREREREREEHTHTHTRARAHTHTHTHAYKKAKKKQKKTPCEEKLVLLNCPWQHVLKVSHTQTRQMVHARIRTEMEMHPETLTLDDQAPSSPSPLSILISTRQSTQSEGGRKTWTWPLLAWQPAVTTSFVQNVSLVICCNQNVFITNHL